VASGATCVQRPCVSYVNDTSERVPSRLKSPPLAALPEAFAPWDSCEPYPTPSCGACPAPAAGALRRASPCAGALRRVRPPRARHPGRGVAAGGCRWRVPGGALPSWRRESAFEFPIRSSAEWALSRFCPRLVKTLSSANSLVGLSSTSRMLACSSAVTAALRSGIAKAVESSCICVPTPSASGNCRTEVR